MATKYSPLVVSILSARSLGVELIPVIKKLLKYILETAAATVEKERKNIAPVSNDYMHLDVIDELMEAGVCFPGRPVQRMVKKVNLGSQGERCNKFYKSNSRLGAGLLLFWCANHRRSLGFVVLPSSESLEIVYDTILTRFKKMPKVNIVILFLYFEDYLLRQCV